MWQFYVNFLNQIDIFTKSCTVYINRLTCGIYFMNTFDGTHMSNDFRSWQHMELALMGLSKLMMSTKRGGGLVTSST